MRQQFVIGQQAKAGLLRCVGRSWRGRPAGGRAEMFIGPVSGPTSSMSSVAGCGGQQIGAFRTPRQQRRAGHARRVGSLGSVARVATGQPRTLIRPSIRWHLTGRKILETTISTDRSPAGAHESCRSAGQSLVPDARSNRCPASCARISPACRCSAAQGSRLSGQVIRPFHEIGIRAGRAALRMKRARRRTSPSWNLARVNRGSAPLRDLVLSPSSR